MGRRKIEIQPITTERNRSITFQKRKNGLFKKAYELGVLCSVDIAVVIFERTKTGETKCYEYSSDDLSDIVMRRMSFQGSKEVRSPRDFRENVGKDEDEEDEDEDTHEGDNKKSGMAKGKAKAKVKNTTATSESPESKPLAPPPENAPQPHNPLSFPFSAERGSAFPQPPPSSNPSFTPDLETIRWLAGLQAQASAAQTPHQEPWLPTLPPSYSESTTMAIPRLTHPGFPARNPLSLAFDELGPSPSSSSMRPAVPQFDWPIHQPDVQHISKFAAAKTSSSAPFAHQPPMPEIPDMSWLELLSAAPSHSQPSPPPPHPTPTYLHHDGMTMPQSDHESERSRKRQRGDGDAFS